jgi:parallel beta-helix repeat protein
LKYFANIKSGFTGRLSIIGIAILMVVLFSIPVSALCPPPKLNISYPGYYQLDSDIDYPGQNIFINSSDVTLDGMGHTLSGAVSPSECTDNNGIVVVSNVAYTFPQNIHIRNLTVKDKEYGIEFSRVNGGSISDVHAQSNNLGFLIVMGTDIDIVNNILEENTLDIYGSGHTPFGIYIDHSQNVNVRKNSFIKNIYGIEVHYGSQNNISDNVFTENSDNCIGLIGESFTTISNNTLNNNLDGMWFLESNNINANNNKLQVNKGSNPSSSAGIGIGGYNTSDNTINNNSIDNSDVGIVFMNFSYNNIIIKNIVNGSTLQGILIQYSGNNTLLQNTVKNNSVNGIYIKNANSNELMDNNINNNQKDGIRIDFSGQNNVYNNTITSNTQNGIGLHNSSNSQIQNNFLINNLNRGITLENSSQNTIYNNFFNNTNNTRFLGITDQNIWNTTKTPGKNIINGPYLGGNVWAKPDGKGFSQTCADSNHDGICDTAYTLGVNNTDYLPLSLNNTSVIIIPPVSSKIGVFRNSTHQFYLDYNGNGVWNGAAVDRQYNFGISGDIPVTGDWNNNGTTEIGVFRNSTHLFYLDNNGDGVWNGGSIDKQYNFGISGDIPISGDWNNNGTTEIGVFRNSTHVFYLDYNGNGVWNGASVDRQYNFGISGDIPISGDWNLDGTTEIGVFRNSTHVFYLDYNGNGVWNGAAVDKQYNFGISGDIPVTGDWNADGATEIGVFRPSIHLYYLDYNGNGVWNGASLDRQYNFGITGDIPISGKW